MSARFEHLETRRMLANAPQPVEWVIQGSSAADVISITQSGNTVTVNNNGVITTHAAVGYYLPGPSPYQTIGVPGLRKIVVHGRGGNDQVLGDNFVQVPMELYGGAGRDTLRGGAKDDLLKGFEQVHDPMQIIQYIGDELHGNEGNDSLSAFQYGVASILYGGDGDDVLRGSDYGNTINGGRGNDNIIGGDAADSISAGPVLIMSGNGEDRDTVDSGDGADTVWGGVGNDLLITGEGDDQVGGGVGNDSVHASYGDDEVFGESGNDVMYLGEGADEALGGDGNDTIYGNGGNDSLYGDAGDDSIQGGVGTDAMGGGAGFDTVSYSDHGARVNVNLNGGTGQGSAGENDFLAYSFEAAVGGLGDDRLTGNVYDNKFYGGSGDDQVNAGDGNDSIYGEGGNDSLQGGRGSDKIYGNDGHDVLWGGRDADSLFAGSGDDTLVTIGGSTTDKSWGESGTDSFWLDNNGNEFLDATAFEHNDGRVHKVSSFHNSSSVELDGQNLWDPTSTLDAMFWTSFPNRPLFASNGPSIDDVNQGNLGDCYFLAGLASIAQKGPGWIHERICDLGDDTYAVMFEGSYIRVDNQLPTAAPGGGPEFAGFGLEGSMWVPIMEKAFAYWRDSGDRSYGALDGGDRDEPFDMLGIQCEDFWDGDNDDLLQGLWNAVAGGNAVTASTESGEFENGMMLVPSHVYSVVSVNLNDQTVRLRNPWGTDAGGESGDWHDGNNDGYITLSINTFREGFRDTTVGYI
jgi:Ca2+-binding RTX toxin-like protein